MFFIFAINPGSTSTKIGYFEDGHCMFKDTLWHSSAETAPGLDRDQQAGLRREKVINYLNLKKVDLGKLSAMVVRGGLLKPLVSGTYYVDDAIYADLLKAKYGWHASNLGTIIALPLTRELGIPLYTVDPVTVDEFEDEARYSGLKGIARLSMSHALNMKAMARKAANNSGKRYEELNLIVTHLGSGISVSAHLKGKMIDVNNANEEGPFSLERCGTMPSLGLVRFCFSGKYNLEQLMCLLTKEGGVYSYLGTKNFVEVENMATAGDREATAVLLALAYQVAKEIGAMAAVLKGAVDLVVITGGMANAVKLVTLIQERISFIAPVQVIPGEEELEALAAGALRVLREEEKALSYQDV
jgi:butyrate kinase